MKVKIYKFKIEMLIQEPKEPERRSRSKKKELWNYQNPAHKRAVKQSEKDTNENRRQASEYRRRESLAVFD
jgi:hypothetical protein